MSRENFEIHALSKGLSLARASEAMMFANGRRVAAGDYILPDTASAWDAWQAVDLELQIAGRREDRANEMIRKHDHLLAELAERDALLRECRADIKDWKKVAPAYKGSDQLLERIDSVLSKTSTYDPALPETV